MDYTGRPEPAFEQSTETRPAKDPLLFQTTIFALYASVEAVRAEVSPW
ncbi:hypothetical protein LGI69_002942 [Salmonella enterica]|nr:hypothetical protein [Salmonella enterica]